MQIATTLAGFTLGAPTSRSPWARKTGSHGEQTRAFSVGVHNGYRKSQRRNFDLIATSRYGVNRVTGRICLNAYRNAYLKTISREFMSFTMIWTIPTKSCAILGLPCMGIAWCTT